jgi:hypothetical protein
MGRKPTTNNETKDANNSGLKWAPQALRPLVSCILSLVSYKKVRAGVGISGGRCQKTGISSSGSISIFFIFSTRVVLFIFNISAALAFTHPVLFKAWVIKDF